MNTVMLRVVIAWWSFLALPAVRCVAVEAPNVAAYGTWLSPITARMLVEKSVQIGDISLDGETLYWVESRPEEEGRNVIVKLTKEGVAEDILPAPFSARTLVHEYGGGAFLASKGQIFFSNFSDQRIWRIGSDKTPQAVTAEHPFRFADGVHDVARDRLICVCEDHGHPQTEPSNRIVSIRLSDGDVTTLVAGADFYSSPRIDRESNRLAWLAWNHPRMPWDGSELHVATLRPDGSLGQTRKVAGGETESIFQPEWGPDGALYFVSDRTNWWNLYREQGGRIQPIAPMEAEFGVPQWLFGMRTYGFDNDGNVVARFTRDGKWYVARIDLETGTFTELSLPYTTISSLHVNGLHAYAVASSPTTVDALIQIDLATNEVRTIRRTSPLEPDADYTSIPEAIEYPTDDGLTAHAFYYPPKNRDYVAPADESPPLLVIIHGGPTSAARARFSLSIQYWTSRGFGVCDVNYGGSTGYGREYRNRLRESWGVVDVSDATNAAMFLARNGRVDAQRLIIRGGSAGGYTTLACLTFKRAFRCGASYYGVSDLELLTRETHKFESRYLDQLVGPYPRAKRRYQERSPSQHLDRFERPVILLQGLEDKVVPPNQAELIFESLKQKGVPVAYVPFEGEQHGFRKAETIIRAHEAELSFYSQVLQFTLPDEIEPVQIFNLPRHPTEPR